MCPVFFIVMHKWASENILCKFLALMQFSASFICFSEVPKVAYVVQQSWEIS